MLQCHHSAGRGPVSTTAPGRSTAETRGHHADLHVRLNQYHIDDTRSVHNDTNVVGYTLNVGQGKDSFTQTLPPQDVNNGNHDMCLEFPSIEIDDPTTLIGLAFTIVNAGHNSTAVVAAFQQGVGQLVGKAATGVSGLAGAEIGAAFIAVDVSLALLFADCDGTVAADNLSVAISAYDAVIPAGCRVLTHTKSYPGTGSADGCGGNSRYDVTQTVIRTETGDVNQPQYGRTFLIAGRSSGLVLEVPGSNTASGVPIQQGADQGGTNQHWQLVPTDSGFFKIRSVSSNLILEVAGNSKDDHAKIQQATDLDGINQHFAFDPFTVAPPNLPFPVLPDQNAYFKIRSRSSGKVFDVESHSASPGVQIQQFSPNSPDNSNNQIWQLLSVDQPPPGPATPHLK
jgi:hypothetical protein